ncbi:Transcription factor GATA-6 [Stylosanthes scabra]|uniref:Transcription factor GATA-6 n=1 Tax=Stylosanthes scabra TaxID=79078 RepID=A0ABU6W6B8_9FABA|nr:Transcription factor GATA-6 [Stylosanthes scabra]
MLYQTPHPLLFQFHPFPSSSSPSLLSILPLSSHLPLIKVEEREMECMVEGALKTSFRKEMKYSTSPQRLFMEELSLQNNGAPSDDLFVDQLLDFSHVEVEQEEEEEGAGPGVDSASESAVSPQHSHHQVEEPFPPLPTTDLNLPDDVADLEWLSHFVEDSFSPPMVAAALPTNSFKASTPHPCFNTPVPAKARTKRTRTGLRVWPLASPSFATTDSSSTSSTSSSPSMDHLSSNAPPKKPKKKPSPEPGFPAQAPRRCTHCGVQKTPQWRTGPLGAKTLCNACGVRYKSGRLLPEYRPACSPTFSSELHSNHHRKVLEMRRKKETISGGVDTAGLAPPPVVPSF